MTVAELIDKLNECNPDADITSVDCRMFQLEHYYPICLEYLKVDHETFHQEESSSKEANVILIH
jgi:hypothetical protein